jgi:hypothetical protein
MEGGSLTESRRFGDKHEFVYVRYSEVLAPVKAIPYFFM